MAFTKLPEQLFLEWTAPCLEQAAETLLERHLSHGELDLRKCLLVFPAQRAARRILELLLEGATRMGAIVLPPRTATVGGLPEAIMTRRPNVASALERAASWRAALLQLPEDLRVKLCYSEFVEGDLSRGLVLFDELDSLWQELAAQGMTFADVEVKVRELGLDFEEERWNFLAQSQRAYFSALKGNNLEDLHHFRLRVKEEQLIQDFEQLYLIACVDLPKIHQGLLEMSGIPITVLSYCGEEYREGFDSWGRLKSEYWKDLSLEIPERSVARCSNSSDQAFSAIQQIADWSVRNPDDVSLGVVDEDCLPILEQAFESQGISFRSSVGSAPESSPIYSLLQILVELCDQDAYAAFARFVRHPLMQRYMEREFGAEQIVSLVDDFFQKHLPAKFSEIVFRSSGNLSVFAKALERYLIRFRAAEQELPRWCELVSEFMSDFALFDPNTAELLLRESYHVLQAQLENLSSVFQNDSFKTSGSEALRCILYELGRTPLYPLTSERAVEGIGWLEVLLDDAPNLILLGFQQGIVPDHGGSELFLSDSLKRDLGIPDREARTARDRYLVASLLHSKEKIAFLYSEASLAGEHLFPSPFLFDAHDHKSIPPRVHLLLGERTNLSRSTTTFFSDSDIKSSKGTYSIPKPERVEEEILHRVSATAFRDYLACPYRFYLRHVLKLRSIGDQALELDGAGFGSVFHRVLERFAASSNAESPDRDKVIASLLAALDEVKTSSFGRAPVPAVVVQLEQLRHRLMMFADWQTERNVDGWKIHLVERSLASGECLLTHRCGITEVVGRIDRVDFHPRSGDYELIDFKTFEKKKNPSQTHLTGAGEWIDLQLPLYLHALSAILPVKSLSCGYLCLASEGPYSFERADWDGGEIQEAVRVAATVAEKICEQTFWPPNENRIAFDDFADICGVGQFAEMYGSEVEEVES